MTWVSWLILAVMVIALSVVSDRFADDRRFRRRFSLVAFCVGLALLIAMAVALAR